MTGVVCRENLRPLALRVGLLGRTDSSSFGTELRVLYSGTSGSSNIIYTLPRVSGQCTTPSCVKYLRA